MENSASDFGQHILSFFKNSCPETSAEGATVEDYFDVKRKRSIARATFLKVS